DEANLTTYRSSTRGERTFCSTCGSNIYVAIDAEPDMRYVAMGVIDGNPPLPRGYHIYVGSKAPWHEITDDLRQYDKAPADEKSEALRDQ
ncbi:MAG: GFA family protein, partial [Gammaproteobacteria bacterium]|nr:GFA family protein [Gammaproteobacteria bacterium]